jgi:hypothetical protein
VTGALRNRLDLLDLQYAQIGEPTVKAKERIVISTEVFRFGLPGGGAIEHAAHQHAINACAGDAEPDDATSEDVHDQHHPMAAQEDGFNAEQIDTPDTVLSVRDECQPGRTIGTGLRSKCIASTRRTTSLSISMPKA